MGFCLFNNVAIAAMHALERSGLSRVAIVDIDVHHGNGTQDAFWAEPRVLYFSTHQFPFYPGTGNWDETAPEHRERAVAAGCGAPVRGGLRASCVLLCAVSSRAIHVSAGFDAHFADPLARGRSARAATTISRN